MKKVLVFAVALAMVLCFGVSPAAYAAAGDTPVVGIAWRSDTDNEFLTNVEKAVEAAGGRWILLDKVISADLSYDGSSHLTAGVDEFGALTGESAKLVRCNSWHGSNVEAVVQDVDIVLFTGGEDISSSLFYIPEKSHGIPEEIDYNAERDVSDYLTMSYCLDKDIPVMGFCRGMQMLSVVSGAEIIQDLPTYFKEAGLKYDYQHRNEKTSVDAYRDYAPHDVTVEKDSHLHWLTDSDVLHAVPSWHHQAVKNVDNTRLTVTGYTDTNGLRIIEAVERTDKAFAVGLQFHPEAAIAKHLSHAPNSNEYIDYDTALKIFRKLLTAQWSEERTAA